jgi:c(7)-type cytochrome triheme protein
MTTRKTTKWAVALAVVLATGFASGDLKNLPKDQLLPVGEGSPGPVRFSHESHVDADQPRCVSCHPLFFRILERSAQAKRITHDAMEKGKQSCGACHGQTAFGFDDCTMCHQE